MERRIVLNDVFRPAKRFGDLFFMDASES